MLARSPSPKRLTSLATDDALPKHSSGHRALDSLMTSLPTDSAGVPWEGRSFAEHPPSDDDGSAPPQLIAALEKFAAGGCSVVHVVEAVRASRLLIPLVAELAEGGLGVDRRTVDKMANLGIVAVRSPDGRRVLPVFSSVEAMKRWNPDARPVPADAVRVALAAASEDTELVVLDPGSITEFVMRRPAVWAIAQGLTWVPSFLDDEVLAAFLEAAGPEKFVAAVLLDSGDPTARLVGPELEVTVAVRAGLARDALDALLRRLSERISVDALIAARVDSLALRVIDAAVLDRPYE